MSSEEMYSLLDKTGDSTQDSSEANSGIEVSGGVIGVFEATDELFLYGGLEFLPFSTMKAESKTKWKYTNGRDNEEVSSSRDLKREVFAGINFGAKYMMNDGMFIHGKVMAVGEKSYTIGAGMDF